MSARQGRASAADTTTPCETGEPDEAGCDRSAAPLCLHWWFPATALHCHRARAWFSTWIDDQWPPDDAARAGLAFSEVVTNAVVHGVGPVTVDVRADGHELVCEVGDRSGVMPVMGKADEGSDPFPDLDEGGRGLYLVDTLVDEWDVRRESGSGTAKTVWFVIRVGAESAA